MAVIEGHAEHVMDEAGATRCPRWTSCARRSSAAASSPRRWPGCSASCSGMELKLRQYRLGKSFCDAVVEAEGIPALNRVWRGSDSLPTLAELEDPQAWLRRTREPVSA